MCEHCIVVRCQQQFQSKLYCKSVNSRPGVQSNLYGRWIGVDVFTVDPVPGMTSWKLSCFGTSRTKYEHKVHTVHIKWCRFHDSCCSPSGFIGLPSSASCDWFALPEYQEMLTNPRGYFNFPVSKRCNHIRYRPTSFNCILNSIDEKLVVPHLLKNFPAFYGIWKFIFMFKRGRHMFLFWATWSQFFSCILFSQSSFVHFNIRPVLPSTSR